MKNIIDQGFTVCIANNGTDLNGCGLKNLGDGRGMEPAYFSEDELLILEQFPSTLQLLNEGMMVQIYKGNYGTKIYPYYIAQIGTIVPEGSYAETERFDIVAESAASDFYDGLIGLEEQCEKLAECSHELPIKKAYRLYGSPRYEVHNMNF